MFADQRAATVSLAGVHTAMSVPGTEHAGQDRLDMGSQVTGHIVRWATWDEEEYSRPHSLLDTRGRGADRRQSPWILSYADKRNEFLSSQLQLVLTHSWSCPTRLLGRSCCPGSRLCRGRGCRWAPPSCSCNVNGAVYICNLSAPCVSHPAPVPLGPEPQQRNVMAVGALAPAHTPTCYRKR